VLLTTTGKGGLGKIGHIAGMERKAAWVNPWRSRRPVGRGQGPRLTFSAKESRHEKSGSGRQKGNRLLWTGLKEKEGERGAIHCKKGE